MENQDKDLTVDETRRKFLEKAGKVSVAAPAAAILLSGGIPTLAQAGYPGGGGTGGGGTGGGGGDLSECEKIFGAGAPECTGGSRP